LPHFSINTVWGTGRGSPARHVKDHPGQYGGSCQRTGFSTRLKCNKVGIDKEKTSRVIVREKLSKRAVVKEDGLRRVYLLREEINTNRNLARVTTKSKSGTQTVSNGCVG